jgi:hypothetical protein
MGHMGAWCTASAEAEVTSPLQGRPQPLLQYFLGGVPVHATLVNLRARQWKGIIGAAVY